MDCLIRNPKNKKEVLEILSLLKICFPGMKEEYFIKRILRDPGYKRSLSFIMTTNGRIISHAQLFNKEITLNTGKKPFLGLGFICTSPEFRNKGHATKLLKHIMKDSGQRILGLFTKITDYYKKLGFKIVPRKRIIIKSADFNAPLAAGLKIRKFDARRNLSSVIRIYKKYFSSRQGAVNRNPADWKAQLSYFNEEKRLFLVAESDNQVKAYIRCKLIKPANDRIEIVEYASIDKTDDLILDFISYLFKKLAIKEIRGWKYFLRPALKNTSRYEEEVDTKMMLRFNGSCRQSDIKKGELCFLESDGF